jgi:hypothetical protein
VFEVGVGMFGSFFKCQNFVKSSYTGTPKTKALCKAFPE